MPNIMYAVKDESSQLLKCTLSDTEMGSKLKWTQETGLYWDSRPESKLKVVPVEVELREQNG